MSNEFEANKALAATKPEADTNDLLNFRRPIKVEQESKPVRLGSVEDSSTWAII